MLTFTIVLLFITPLSAISATGPESLPSFLTVVIYVINDDGGTTTPNDFGIFAISTMGGIISLQSGESAEVPAGAYTITVLGLPGYELVGFYGDCTEGLLFLRPGQVGQCVVVFDDLPTPL